MADPNALTPLDQYPGFGMDYYGDVYPIPSLEQAAADPSVDPGISYIAPDAYDQSVNQAPIPPAAPQAPQATPGLIASGTKESRTDERSYRGVNEAKATRMAEPVLQGINEAYDQKRAAAANKEVLTADMSRAQQPFMEQAAQTGLQRATEVDARNAAVEARVAKRMAEFDGALAEANATVDPSRRYARASTGEKVAAVLSIAMGSWVQDKFGPPVALAIIKQEIERDIDAQKFNIEAAARRAQMVGQQINQEMDISKFTEQMHQEAYISRLDAVKAQAQAVANSFGDRQSQAAFATISADLDAERMKTVADWTATQQKLATEEYQSKTGRMNAQTSRLAQQSEADARNAPKTGQAPDPVFDGKNVLGSFKSGLVLGDKAREEVQMKVPKLIRLQQRAATVMQIASSYGAKKLSDILEKAESPEYRDLEAKVGELVKDVVLETSGKSSTENERAELKKVLGNLTSWAARGGDQKRNVFGEWASGQMADKVQEYDTYLDWAPGQRERLINENAVPREEELNPAPISGAKARSERLQNYYAASQNPDDNITTAEGRNESTKSFYDEIDATVLEAKAKKSPREVFALVDALKTVPEEARRGRKRLPYATYGYTDPNEDPLTLLRAYGHFINNPSNLDVRVSPDSRSIPLPQEQWWDVFMDKRNQD